MKLSPDTLYHIYNRDNNKQVIFIEERNYTFFLKKAVKELEAHVHFLSYCLMPNHFHFLIYSKSNFDTTLFSNSMRILFKFLHKSHPKARKNYRVAFPAKY